jgi:hypothetical protein
MCYYFRLSLLVVMILDFLICVLVFGSVLGLTHIGYTIWKDLG